MNIEVSQYAGFCPGVKRAEAIVEKAIASARHGEQIYTLGKLIHNRIYNKELERKGVRSVTVDELPQICDKNPTAPITVIIRTHGVTKEVYAALRAIECERHQFKIIDATCSYVKKIHKLAEENTGDDTYFLLFCSPGHPEAMGIMSYAKGEKLAAMRQGQ